MIPVPTLLLGDELADCRRERGDTLARCLTELTSPFVGQARLLDEGGDLIGHLLEAQPARPPSKIPS